MSYFMKSIFLIIRISTKYKIEVTVVITNFDMIHVYIHGEALNQDLHFQDHIDCHIPIQAYCNNKHVDIGFVERYSSSYIKMNGTYYSRNNYTFISRPGY